jgi:hypothetical protein
VVGFIGFKDGGVDLNIAAATDGIDSSTELLASRRKTTISFPIFFERRGTGLGWAAIGPE